jgi:hypothetical protein
VRGVRSGLASRGVAPQVLSGAARGHDRVRDGTGWGPRALGHEHRSPPARGQRRDSLPRTHFAPNPRVCERRARRSLLSARPRALHASVLSSIAVNGASRGNSSSWRGPLRRLATRCDHPMTRKNAPPSTIRTARLRSVTRRPPAAYRPGHLPGVLPHQRVGRLVLGRDSRLDAFSGSPVRTWLPSAAGCPTTGAPAVRPPRSSRTRGSPPQPPTARGG